eukprot:jgi/Mesen1/10982/ME000096S10551
MGILRVIGLFNLVCVASFFLVADAACRSHLRSSGVPKWKSPLGMLRERMGIDRPTAATDSLQGPRLQEWPIDIRPEGPASGLLTEEQPEVGHYAGYYRLNRTHDTRMFYWFFESRGNKSEDPVVLWMTGGPGCASEVALFYENGPWKIHPENLTLHWNDYGWDKVSNIIYVDQPVNTGFSYSSDPRDIRHDEPGISQDVFEFLQDFFEAHPDYQGREFFVTGESYGGHYVPAVSSRVHAGNQAKEGNFINLQGFAIGNGLTQPEIQYAAYADFALQNGLISESAHKSFQRKYAVCNMAVKACGEFVGNQGRSSRSSFGSGTGTKGKLSCAAAFVICNTYFQNLFLQSGSGHLNVYDIRENCTVEPLCYDFSALDEYLNQATVRAALGVGAREFQDCSTLVYEAMIVDFMRNIEPLVPPLLEASVRALVYAGEKDFICNWLGNSRWVAALPWSGHEAYNAAPAVPFEVAGREAGVATSAGPLTFLKVHDAGHMVPMDQPEAALEMLTRFLQNKPFDESLVSPQPLAGASVAAI